MADANAFDQFDTQSGGALLPAAPAAPAPAPPANPFDQFGDVGTETSPVGTFFRGIERAAAPALGSLPAIGAGAEAGAGLGAFGGPFAEITAPAGAIVGGIAGGLLGSTAISSAQDWALSKLPDSWREAIGQSDRQQKLDAEQHPIASFLGGVAPYAVTMQPGGFARAALPPNATTLQRIMANPITARLFGGAAVGGIEAGQEIGAHEAPDWRKIAISTGFGLIMNRPNRIGEAIENIGAAPVRALTNAATLARGLNEAEPAAAVPRAPAPITTPGEAPLEYPGVTFAPPLNVYRGQRPPTLNDAADMKVSGPGITESVFQGGERQNPVAEMTAQDNARTEQSILNPPPQPDLTALARKMEPEIFARSDELNAQYNSFKARIDQLANPPDDELEAAQTGVTEAQNALDTFIASRNGYAGGPDARRLRAQLRDAQAQAQEGADRRAAYAEGRAEETPELAALRQQLQAVDFAMRDNGRDVAAAYRRAAESLGAGAEPVPEIPQPELSRETVPAQAAQVPVGGTPVAQPTAPLTPEQVAMPPRAVVPAENPIDRQRAFIANDVTQQLTAAGRPADEAAAAGHLIAERYVARAGRLRGALGTPAELYRREGAAIQGERAAPQAPRRTRARAPEEPAFIPTTRQELAEFLAQGGEVSAPGRTLKQGAQAKIRFTEGRRPLITLMRDANASSFIHETGHQFLEELLRDASHPQAPDSLEDDATTVRDWLGLDTDQVPRTKEHERFARGFEQYMREGVAPSPGLARVFEQFKDWLTTIYQTIKGLGKPINNDIRQVFDRLLAEEPQRAIIAPERPTGPTLADVHGADAAETHPEEAAAVAARVDAERARAAAEPPKEVANEIAPIIAEVEAERARAAGPTAGAGARPAGEPRPSEPGRREVGAGGVEARPQPSGGVVGSATGTLGPSLSAAVAEGAGVRGREGPNHLVPGRAEQFGRPESPLVDRAGNIRLENLTNNEDVRYAIAEAAHENNDFIGDRRGVVTPGQVLDLAEALGMTPESLSRRKIGEAFNAEQVMAARKLLIQSATDVSQKMKAAAAGTDQQVLAYAMAKDRHQMIQAQVAGITAEAGRALRAFRSITGEMGQTVGATNEFIKQATGKTLFQLKREAVLGARYDTPEKVSQFMNDARKRSFGQMLLEYWINALISGLQTHVTYSAANLMLSLWKTGPETGVAAMIGAARQRLGQNRERVYLGEIGAQLRGGQQGLAPAMKAAADAIRTGATTLLPGERGVGTYGFRSNSAILDEGAKLTDATGAAYGIVQGIRDGFVANAALSRAGQHGFHYAENGAIPDLILPSGATVPIGTLARLPSRMVGAEHSFFRALNYSMEINGLAYRQAAAEGLTGHAFDQRLGELRKNPTPQMMETARLGATDTALMGRGGQFTQALSRLTNVEIDLPALGKTPILKFIDPFVHISSNIMRQGLLDRTVLGVLAPTIRADLAGRNGPIAQDMAAARMLVGTAFSLAIGGLAAEGLATGSGPSNPKAQAMWRLAGYQPYSIRIGDMWYDTHRLGPIGMLMGVSADLYDVAHAASKGQMLEAAATLQHAVTQNVLDESFMRGPADLIQAVTDPGRYGQAYLKDQISSFVPFSVGMAQLARSTDPYSRQARTVLDAIKRKIPGLSETLLPRRDIWGEPMPANMAVPFTAIYENRISADPVNKAMLDLGIASGQPSRYVRNVHLTDEQYDDYQRIAGRMAKMRLDAIVRSPDYQRWPDTVRHDIITETINQSRESARGLLLAKYPQILRAATQARMDKLR